MIFQQNRHSERLDERMQDRVADSLSHSAVCDKVRQFDELRGERTDERVSTDFSKLRDAMQDVSDEKQNICERNGKCAN